MLKWIALSKRIVRKCLNFFYPPTCHSCDEWAGESLLCEVCSALLEPFYGEGCCIACLSDQECFCMLIRPQIQYSEAAFLAEGPILDLNTSLLAKPLARLAYARFLQKELPLPTSVISVNSKKFGREFAKKIGAPFNVKETPKPLIVEAYFDEAHLFSLANENPGASIFTLLSPLKTL